MGTFPGLDKDKLEQFRTFANQNPKEVTLDLAGIPQIKPTFLGIAPSGIPSNIIPHSKGIKCGLIRSNSPFVI